MLNLSSKNCTELPFTMKTEISINNKSKVLEFRSYGPVAER